MDVFHAYSIQTQGLSHGAHNKERTFVSESNWKHQSIGALHLRPIKRNKHLFPD